MKTAVTIEKDETPSKRRKLERERDGDIETKNVVTPTPSLAVSAVNESAMQAVSRNLFTAEDRTFLKSPCVTPKRSEPKAKKKLIFGRLVDEINIQPNVRKVYGIIRKLTGSIGGNGSHGPIYGELTMTSMQKVINLMKEHMEFNSNSKFIDVGSGIGKPNLHVCQDPGVKLSYGIEIEQARWILGMTCLKGVLDAAVKEENDIDEAYDDETILHRCMFEHGDIRSAKSFNPFTHVYMFSIGFPPSLWIHLSQMWNASASPYLICYHGPKDIIDSYEFDAVLIAQAPTSMHGSKEGHTVYLYGRTKTSEKETKECDPLFKSLEKRVDSGLHTLHGDVTEALQKCVGLGRATRSSHQK